MKCAELQRRAQLDFIQPKTRPAWERKSSRSRQPKIGESPTIGREEGRLFIPAQFKLLDQYAKS